MPSLVEPARRNGPLRLLLMLAAAGLGWRVMAIGWAAHLAHSDPAAALAWHPVLSEAQLRQGEQQLRERAAVPVLASLARAGITANPLDHRGYRLLAQTEQATKRNDSAERLYEIAAKRNARDLPSLVWLTNRALQRGETELALRRIDRMLRAGPGMLGAVLPALSAAAVLPETRPALLSILREQPPWRSAFLANLVRQVANASLLFDFHESLRREAPGLTAPELQLWLEMLLRDRHWSSAYLVWVDSLPEAAAQSIGNVYNGGFEWQPSGAGFDWRLERVAGARSRLAAVPGAGGQQALQVQFEDRRTPFAHVRQLLALAPGTYRLQGRVRLDDLRSERGLVWTVTCAEGGAALAQTDAFRGRRNWSEFQAGFSVPANACGAQWLTLRIPARIPAERLIGGTAWFDDLRITRE